MDDLRHAIRGPHPSNSQSAIRNPQSTDPRLFNPDLAATSPGQRTWNLWHIAALWVGMAVCVPTYTLASGLIDAGMNWKQAILTIALGNTVVLIPMILNAHAGTKYGIPFPVLARASFGVLGANIPAMLRAFVACGWFGIQTWIGGEAIYQLALTISPNAIPLPQIMPSFVGITTGQFLAFMLFWLINVYFIWNGTESIKWMETLAAPFLIITGLALLTWAYWRAGGWGPILSRPSGFSTWRSFLAFFFPALTAMVGYWATLSLNIPDFTRFAKSQKDQIVGQAMGLPTTMTLFSFIGVAVTSATPLIFGRVIWDPIELMGKVGGVVTVMISIVALSIATLSTNIAANVVSPANDFSNLRPGRISFRAGGMITAFIGIAIMPWKLIASSRGYIFTWLIGYSALLGPIGGIMIADYFLVRKKQLDAEDLYRRHGRYEYSGGINRVAVTALLLGIAPNIPGFLAQAFPGLRLHVSPFWQSFYSYAWFNGFLIAAVVYSIGMRGHRLSLSGRE